MNYLILGASSGIGEACARELAADENTLIVVARREALLQILKKELPGRIVPVAYDLQDFENLDRVFEPCEELGFKLDGMVFCAGIDGTWPVKVNDIVRMQEMMDVNCFSFIEVAKRFYKKKYSNDGASIVAISSIASKMSEACMISYSISKAALNKAVEIMAVEFSRRRIRVNAILPGGVDTPMAKEKKELLSGINSEKTEKNENKDGTGEKSIDTKQPFGLIDAKNIAENVKFLLSDAAEFTTGSLVVIGGGRAI